MVTHTSIIKRRVSVAALVAVLTVLMAPALAFGLDSVNKTFFFGVAIKGFDPVAYFTENRAVKGDSDFEYVWRDAKWYFTSAEHQNLFKADPEAYAPQYGGY
ncbi:hypothetical protein D3OALGA1CA_3373 [Olavius algarvensis associated proteobacterium Delta 3]|nr:hypothetical protein D3OALGB2SA_3133 [Olavius algarvensis associated proteobacterium Delta 3]CAB5133329.1 hypothetical protein D3OALGA1CA_3373 [Olavius algarvensis associated proteobacterium Delta 3]